MAQIRGVAPWVLAMLAIASSAAAQGSSSATAPGGMTQAQRYEDASRPVVVQASTGGTPTETTMVVPTSDYALAPPMQHEHPGLKMGGHVGLGTIIGTAGTGPNTLLGRDTGILGLVAGINLGINKHWSIDLEFIVNSEWMHTTAGTSNSFFILDPGVKYAWGPVWVGMRAAIRVPSPIGSEFGFIPIIGARTNNHGPVHYYIEADFPLFFGSPAAFTFVSYIQTGIAF